MNQTRLFLIFAWLMVATLLWMEWGKEQQAARTPTTPAAQIAAPPAMVPGQAAPAASSAVPTANVPAVAGQQAPVTKAPPSAASLVATKPCAAGDALVTGACPPTTGTLAVGTAPGVAGAA